MPAAQKTAAPGNELPRMGELFHAVPCIMEKNEPEPDFFRSPAPCLSGPVPKRYPAYSPIFSRIAACAAARRAIGTRNGEQDT